MHKVSVREISRATGFSPATVSNALNHKRNVSEETAEKIRAAAKAMGYQHPSQLDAITFVLARKTGAIVDESTFHPSVIEGVERQARRHGMGTAFVSLDFSDLDAVRPQVAALVSDPSAAIVLLGTELGEEDYELFRDSAARLVVLDGWSDRFDFDAVVMANEGSALRAVRYLTERGHKKIGYLSGDFRIQNFRARERGFFRALDEAGLGFDPLWRIELGTTLERAYEDMKAKLANIHQADLPTAFFADNDVLAVGALRALAERSRIDPSSRRTDPRRIELNPYLKISRIETPGLDLTQCLEIIVCKLPLGQLLLEKTFQIGRRQLHAILSSHNLQLFSQNPFYPFFV